MGEDMLASYIVGLCRSWEDYRNANYREKWNEYYRISVSYTHLRAHET